MKLISLSKQGAPYAVVCPSAFLSKKTWLRRVGTKYI